MRNYIVVRNSKVREENLEEKIISSILDMLAFEVSMGYPNGDDLKASDDLNQLKYKFKLGTHLLKCGSWNFESTVSKENNMDKDRSIKKKLQNKSKKKRIIEH